MAQQDPVFQFLNTMPQMLMNVYSQRQREKQSIRDYLNKLNLEIARYGGDIIDVPEGLSAKELERYVPQVTTEIRETFSEQREREEAEKQRARQEARQRYFTSLNRQNIERGGEAVTPQDYSYQGVQEAIPQIYQQAYSARESSEEKRNLEGVINNIESLRRSLISTGVPVGEMPQFDSIEGARNYEEQLQNRLSGAAKGQKEEVSRYRTFEWANAAYNANVQRLSEINEMAIEGKELPDELIFEKEEIKNTLEKLQAMRYENAPEEMKWAFKPPELDLDIDPNPTPPPDTEPPPGGGKKKQQETKPTIPKTPERYEVIPEWSPEGSWRNPAVRRLIYMLQDAQKQFQSQSGLPDNQKTFPEGVGSFGFGDPIEMLRRISQQGRRETGQPTSMSRYLRNIPQQ